MPQQLKPVSLEPVIHNKEATAVRSPGIEMKSSPNLPQLDKAHPKQRRSSETINKLFNFLKNE